MAERRFAGKVAFVAGGGSGIGRATATAFEVVLADIETVGDEEATRLVAEHGEPDIARSDTAGRHPAPRRRSDLFILQLPSTVGPAPSRSSIPDHSAWELKP